MGACLDSTENNLVETSNWGKANNALKGTCSQQQLFESRYACTKRKEKLEGYKPEIQEIRTNPYLWVNGADWALNSYLLLLMMFLSFFRQLFLSHQLWEGRNQPFMWEALEFFLFCLLCIFRLWIHEHLRDVGVLFVTRYWLISILFSIWQSILYSLNLCSSIDCYQGSLIFVYPSDCLPLPIYRWCLK